MSRDLKTLLREAAPTPTGTIDERELVGKALRQRAWMRVGGAALAVLVVAAGVLVAVNVLGGGGGVEIVGQPPQPGTADRSPPQRIPSGEILPGGWAPVPSPLDGLEGEVVVAGPGSGPVLAVGRDLAIHAAGGWQIRADALPAHPDLLAADPAGRWALAVGSGSAGLLGPDTTDVQTVEVPDGLRGGVLGAAWSDDGFVVVGRAARADGETPAYRLDPSARTWTSLSDVPLAVNRSWNSSVVATADGTVVVTGAWLGSGNAPARHRLGAAILPGGSDAWELVDGGGLSPQASDAAPVGDRVLVVDYEGNAAWLNDEGWTRPAPTGARAGECPPELAVTTTGIVLMVKCHQGLVYHAHTDTWQPIALPTNDGISLAGPVGFSDRFVAPRLRLTVSEPEPHDLLVLDPAAAWPIVQGHDGLLAAPPGWDVAREVLTPALAGPAERVTASTAAMPVGGDTCAQVPEEAMEELGPDDALVSIQTRTGADPPDGAPELGTLSELDENWTDAAFLDCAANAEDLVAYWTPAAGGGSFHYLLVVHHRETPQPVIDEALAVANSFRSS